MNSPHSPRDAAARAPSRSPGRAWLRALAWTAALAMAGCRSAHSSPADSARMVAGALRFASDSFGHAMVYCRDSTTGRLLHADPPGSAAARSCAGVQGDSHPPAGWRLAGYAADTAGACVWIIGLWPPGAAVLNDGAFPLPMRRDGSVRIVDVQKGTCWKS